MQKRTRSILDEISNIVPQNEKASVIESRASHIINSSINLINLIKEVYDPETAGELERRFINSIRGQDPSKFVRGIRKQEK